MTENAASPNSSAPRNTPYDPLEACLRAVLAFHDQAMSSASLRSRVAHGQGLWTQDTLLEAADSLGYDTETGRVDPGQGELPALPALCQTHAGSALAVLAQQDNATVLVVDPELSDRPRTMALDALLARLNGATISLLRRELSRPLNGAEEGTGAVSGGGRADVGSAGDCPGGDWAGGGGSGGGGGGGGRGWRPVGRRQPCRRLRRRLRRRRQR